MAQKIINSRIQNKFATLAEWETVWETFKPLKGEIVKFQIPADTDIPGLQTSSQTRVMTKTGDGTTVLKSLPWDSACASDETVLSISRPSAESATLAHGGTFSTLSDLSVSDHTITGAYKKYTLPTETSVSIDTASGGTQQNPSHGGTFDIVSSVAKGNSSHNIDITTAKVKLPAETSVSVDTLANTTKTLAHGGEFTAITAAAKGSTSHNIDVTPTKFTLPTETSISIDQGTGTAQTKSHGNSIDVVTAVTKGDSSHNIDVTTTKITLPSETTLDKGSNQTGESTTLAHGGKFNAVTGTAVSGHTVSDVVTEFTLPAETSLSKGTDTQSSTTATSLSFGGEFNVVTDTTVSGHQITDVVTKFKLPSQTQLSKGTDSEADAQTLSHGDTFTAVIDTTVSNHRITDVIKTFTLPTETAISADQIDGGDVTLSHGQTVDLVVDVTKGTGSHELDVKKKTFTLPAAPSETAVTVDSTTASQVNKSHGDVVNVVTGVAKGDGSHNIDVTVTPIKLPTQTTLSRVKSDETATLTHGGTFSAVTNTTVSNHKITDTVTTFTLPEETPISVLEIERDESNRPVGDGVQLNHGDTIAFVDEICRNATDPHKIDSYIVNYKLPTETNLSKGTDSNSTATLSHGDTFTTVVDTTVSGHQITDVTKTFTLPTETAISVDQGTATTVTPKHGESVTVVGGVTKGDSSHNLDIAKTTIKLPAETGLSKGTDTTGTAKTLTHGGTFVAMTNTTVSGHKITDENTTFTLPTETQLSKSEDETVATQQNLTHGGTFQALTDTKVSGHAIQDVVTTFKMPSETVIKPTTQSADAETLTHGGTFTALTAVSKGTGSHDLTFVPTTFTMPSMPTGAMVFKGTLGTNGSVTDLPTSPVAGWAYKVITAGSYASNACTVGDLLVYDGSAWVLIPSGDDEKKGTVTSVKTGQGLTGGTITSSGTIKHLDITRTDTESSLSPAHGATFQVIDSVSTDTMGHVTSANVKTVTLPSETDVTIDGSTGTQQTPAHGGTFTVVKSVTKGDSSHNVDVVSTSVKLPAETVVSIDETEATKTLSHGATVDVVTAVAKGNTSHNIDVTKTTLTLPTETPVSVDSITASTKTTSHGGTINVVTSVTKGSDSTHDIDVVVTPIKLPAATTIPNLSKGTDSEADAKTLTHGGKFKALTDTTVSGHAITDVVTEFTLPSETTLSKGTDATDTKALSHGGTFQAVTDTGVSGHTVTDTITTFTLPSETTLSKATDSTDTAQTLTHGGTFTAMVNTTVSGHKITDVNKTFTLPTETPLSVTQGTATDVTTNHEDTFTVVTGVTKGTGSHALLVAKANIKLPKVEKDADTTDTAATLTHGGTFTAVVDTVVEDNKIHDVNKTFTLPSETAVSVDNLTQETATLTHGGTFTVVKSVDKGNTSHNIDVTPIKFTMPSETSVSVDQVTGPQLSPSHGGSVTVVTGVVKGHSSHNIDVTKQTINIPSTSAIEADISSLEEDMAEVKRKLVEVGDLREVSHYFISGYSITNGSASVTINAEMFDTFLIHDDAGVYNVSVTYDAWSGVVADYRILAENTGAHVVTVSRKDGAAITTAELSTVNNTVEHIKNGFSVYFNKLHNIVLAQDVIDESVVHLDTNLLVTAEYPEVLELVSSDSFTLQDSESVHLLT